MYFRLKSKQYEENGNTGNKSAMHIIVEKDEVPGLIAIHNEEAVGWISQGPRENFGRIQRSPILKKVDNTSVWSIVCFFIHRDYRNEGVAKQLIQAGMKYAKSKGAKAIEAYPIDTMDAHQAQADLFTGPQVIFEQAGFKEVARRKATRPIFRYKLN